MRAQLLVLFALFASALCIPSFAKAFSSDFSLTQADGSVGQITWTYDVTKKSEKLAFHRQGGYDTIDYRFYSLGVEYLVIEGAEGDSCHLLPLDNQMPTPTARASALTEDMKLIKWGKTVTEISSSEFDLPASCHGAKPMGGLLCSTCISVGNQVINLGCNATASEIANLCGDLFSGVCKTILDQVCTGACQLEDCAPQACCLVGLCTGDTCNGTSSSSSGSVVEEKAPIATGGIFCESCVSVGEQVINLGCNATADEIANLCGNAFEALCKQVLDTFCSNACELEDCAQDTCCLLDICSGSQCNSTSTSTTSSSVSQVRLW